MRRVKAGSLLALALGSAVCVCASANALPDNRVYELVSPAAEENSLIPVGAYSSREGTAVDWEAIGGLGDATSGGINFFQSRRTGGGWQTSALTPSTPKPLGALEQQAPVFWSPDLSQTIFLTPASLAPGDDDSGALDLYLVSTGGQVTWLSQGSQGGSAPVEATFDGATPDAGEVVFSSEESLTPEAVGLEAGTDHAYLYVRDVQAGETHLVDVNDSGELLDPEGAILGNGSTIASGEPPDYTYQEADASGTTTNAISDDGSKIFFESPPPGEEHSTHLYMRQDNSRTVAIDDPESAGSAQYEGASESGSLVFFTSDEGLAGDPNTDKEIYEYDTQTQTLTAISGGGSGSVDGDVVGVSAIANDGSRVYFVARGVLASNMSQDGEVALEGAPNFYLYDTETGKTTFIANLSSTGAEPELGVGPLVAEPDVYRSAYPTPTGEMLVFESNTDLTGQNTSEFFEVYRYDADSGALICISCTPAGVTPTADATLGGSGGGSYAPPSQAVPMSENGSRIFFESPDPVVPEDTNPDRPPESSTRYETEVYEWENGQVSLISDGHAAVASGLDGTTPSGNDVFFETPESLVPEDENPGYFNIYDARVLQPGEALPSRSEAAITASCAGAECRGPGAPPPSFLAPASALLQGASNVTPAVPEVAARKPTARKHGKESQKKRKQNGHAKRERSKHAKSGRRAGRAVHRRRTHGKVG
jgi:hypothetical protein